MFEFCERVDPQACNRATIEALVKAGAFDSLGAKRAQLMAAIDRAMQSGAAAAADRRSGQRGLFGDEEETASAASTALPNLPEFPEKERLAMEKEVLGFYLTSHPLAEHEATLRTYCSHTIGATGEAGTSHGSARRRDAGGDQVFAHEESAARQHEHQVRDVGPRRPRRHHALHPLAGAVRRVRRSSSSRTRFWRCKGAVDRRPGAEEVNLIVNELIPLAELPARFTSGISIRVREEEHGIAALETLREIVRGYPGHEAAEDSSGARRRRQRHDRLPELQRGDRPGAAPPDRGPARPGEFQIHPRRPTHRAAIAHERPPTRYGAG